MKKPRRRRAGATETFSVSVVADTKRALRALAGAEFGDNLAALVTDLAEDARRRTAAGEFLRRRRVPKFTTTELEAQIRCEVTAARESR